ncbi:hypothetical protein J3998_01135 [Thiomicrorhabdus sp. 6S2-11]|uniref:Uncharacterized protein n=1 Tax=Thiomicrorhabdus marina TaxID=2818442 RepID=A0ABS3Q1H0_9GAMM|nr:hypothetical protein [Thiomicrorhabdus marina]MBO1926167.1 hypothetical protein [Thiomicrorhabdus marina]
MRFLNLSGVLLIGVCTNLQAQEQVDYQSAFANYKPFMDAPLGDWYQANQTVEKIGGWRVYMQEGMQSSTPSSSQESPSNGHSHHHHEHSMMQGGSQ